MTFPSVAQETLNGALIRAAITRLQRASPAQPDAEWLPDYGITETFARRVQTFWVIGLAPAMVTLAVLGYLNLADAAPDWADLSRGSPGRWLISVIALIGVTAGHLGMQWTFRPNPPGAADYWRAMAAMKPFAGVARTARRRAV